MKFSTLPLPQHVNPAAVSQVWKVSYEQRAIDASQWTTLHSIQPSGSDKFKIELLLIDIQNTFCMPDFELFVAGRSGTGAIDDNRRLVEFIYHNLGSITSVTVTMDTHQALQIFHPLFLVDQKGNHPAPYTQITAEDIAAGNWLFNPLLTGQLPGSINTQQSYLRHYTAELEARGKYNLTIWPYHAMLGGIGHALVPAVEEAIFFHAITRNSQPEFILKGENPLTEHYSAIGPEILTDADQQPIATRNKRLLEKLQDMDALIIAGQAKSHCVAWTIADLLEDIQEVDPSLARKIYLLEDCTSPVVVPGADFTEAADAAYQRFSEAGMHCVQSTSSLDEWPGLLK